MAFFSKKQIGLSVSDNSLEVVLSGGSKFFQTTLKPGIIKNGRLKNKKEFSAILLDLFSSWKFNLKLDKKIIFGIPDNYVFYHVFKSSGVIKEKERQKIILKEISEHIPFSLEEISFKYRVLSKGKDFETILVVAVVKDILQEWFVFFKDFGVSVDFDLTPQALFRVVKMSAVCLVDIGKDLTAVSLFFQNKLFYAYTTFIAGDYFTKSLSSGLKKTFEEAEVIKIKNGLFEGDEKVNKYLLKDFSLLNGEIEEALNYAKEDFGFEVKNIVFTGGGAKLKGITEYYKDKKEFTISTESVKINKKRDGQEFAEAYGLSLKNSKHNKEDFIFNYLDFKLNKKDNLIKNNMPEKKGKTALPEMVYGRKHGPNFFQHIVLLCAILLFGVIGLKYAIIYRNNQRDFRVQENKKYVVQYSVIQEAEFKIPIIFSPEFNADVSLPAHLIETEINPGEDYDVAKERGLKEVIWLINEDEYLWEKPIDNTLNIENFPPEKIKWVAFNKTEARNLFLKEINKINKDNVEFALNNLIYKDIIKDSKQGVYYLDAVLYISSNQVIKSLVEKNSIDYIVY